MQKRFGLPFVNSHNASKIFKDLGITSWKQIGEAESLSLFKSPKSGSIKKEDLPFVPKIERVSFRNPGGGIFTGFQKLGRPSSVIFTLLPGNLVPVCAEFKHAFNVVSINLPGGGIEPKESLLHSAKREFQEETGIKLKKVIALNPNGLSSDPRFIKQKLYSFFGIPSDPISNLGQKLDPNEFLAVALMPLSEWLKMIERGKVYDGQSVITTFLAMMYLKKNEKFRDLL